MAKPPCLCTGRVDIRCDEGAHCDILDSCRICWQALYSPPHRQLWGIAGAALAVPSSVGSPAPLAPRPRAAAPLPAAAAEAKPRVLRAGDRLETMLSAVGVTPARVAKWLGSCRGCSARKHKLNELSAWAENAVKQTAAEAKSVLLRLIGG